MTLTPEQLTPLILDDLGTGRSAAGHSVNRRDFLRVAAVAGMAAGLTFLDWVPTGRRAHAGHTGYTYHSGCAGIDNGQYAYGGCCACGSNVDPYYCDNGWHRHDATSGSGYTTDFTIRHQSCNEKNAWIWTQGDGDRWRCSDGKAKTCTPEGCSTTKTNRKSVV